MGDHDGIAASNAVELPPPRVLRSEPRRHRLLTGTSGLLLFACLFLPAVEGCSAPVVPLDAPAFWPPYLYGLIFAFAALARTRRGIIGATIALRTLAILVMGAGFGYSFFAAPIGAFLFVFGSLLLATVGWSSYGEHRLAATAIAIASTSCVWFALWSCTPAALLGVKLSLVSALGLLAGSLVWMREALRSARPRFASRLPHAILHDRF